MSPARRTQSEADETEGLTDDELDALADRIAERQSKASASRTTSRARATGEPSGSSGGTEGMSFREIQRIAREETEAILAERKLADDNAARDAEIAALKAEKEAKVERKPTVFSKGWRFLFGEPAELEDETTR